MLILPKNTAPTGDISAGAILLIDKPLAWTSFDVVNRVRHLLKKYTGDKKLKVGHAGTLDPLATGLLVVCVGKYTKRIDELQAQEKTYTGVITLGATTPSFDLEKPVSETFPVSHLNLELLQKASLNFIGRIQQVPPVFSAVKVDGRRMYKNARTGEEVEMPHREVEIRSFTLSHFRDVGTVAPEAVILSQKGATIWQHPDYAEGKQVDFEVTCSKGTYIRSLANDLGAAAGSGGYLSALRRTGSGQFQVDNAWTMEELTAVFGGQGDGVKHVLVLSRS